MNQIDKTFSDQTMAMELGELSRKTGLVVRRPDSAEVKALFAELEEYDSQERAGTFNFLKRAINETRPSLGAESVYADGWTILDETERALSCSTNPVNFRASFNQRGKGGE